MFKDALKLLEYAGFASFQADKDTIFTVREKSDRQYEVMMNNKTLSIESTPDEALKKMKVGIDKMKKLNEADRPELSASEWVQTDDGMDFVAELIYRAESGLLRRYDIGLLLREFGILATGDYISYFVGMIEGHGFKVIG